MTAVLEKSARNPATHAGATPALSGKKNSAHLVALRGSSRKNGPVQDERDLLWLCGAQAGKNKKMKFHVRRCIIHFTVCHRCISRPRNAVLRR